MPLIHEISSSKTLSIGDLTLKFEAYDHADKKVMLVIYDLSKPLFWRHHAFHLSVGESIQLPNGVDVKLHHPASQKRISLVITNPSMLQITKGYVWERNNPAPSLVNEPNQIATCQATGCSRSAYNSKLCSKCLEERLPMLRDQVSVRELMHTRLLGWR